MMIPEDAGYKEVKELNFQTRSVAKGIGVLKVLKKLVYEQMISLLTKNMSDNLSINGTVKHDQKFTGLDEFSVRIKDYIFM